MPGPPPKPASQRRRRNAAPAVQKLPAGGRTLRERPQLPLEDPCPSTVAWWETIWASPMAAVWLEADVPALVRLAQLVDAVARGHSDARILAEIRHLEDRFGLSPLARRRLQWEIDQASAGDEAPGGAKTDRSRFLRAVS